MIRRALLVLLATLPALAGAEFDAWVKRMGAKGTQVSAGTWDLATGKALEGHLVDQALVPAITTKVLSTYAMFRTWKADFQVETEVWGDLQGGVVRGDLVL